MNSRYPLLFHRIKVLEVYIVDIHKIRITQPPLSNPLGEHCSPVSHQSSHPVYNSWRRYPFQNSEMILQPDWRMPFGIIAGSDSFHNHSIVRWLLFLGLSNGRYHSLFIQVIPICNEIFQREFEAFSSISRCKNLSIFFGDETYWKESVQMIWDNISNHELSPTLKILPFHENASHLLPILSIFKHFAFGRVSIHALHINRYHTYRIRVQFEHNNPGHHRSNHTVSAIPCFWNSIGQCHFCAQSLGTPRRAQYTLQRILQRSPRNRGVSHRFQCPNIAVLRRL